MQERVKTSFIPKQSLVVERKQATNQNPIGIVNVLATIILLITIFSAVGLFLFEQYVAQSIERKRESLDRARAAFEPATIKELARLDARLGVAKTLLGAHIAPSALFDEIERMTLSSVRFKDFSFTELAAGKFAVTMAGEARSFNALALQSDAFGESDFFLEPIFSNLNLDDVGNVVFNFSGTIDTNQIRYQAGNRDTVNTPTEVTP